MLLSSSLSFLMISAYKYLVDMMVITMMMLSLLLLLRRRRVMIKIVIRMTEKGNDDNSIFVYQYNYVY